MSLTLCLIPLAFIALAATLDRPRAGSRRVHAGSQLLVTRRVL